MIKKIKKKLQRTLKNIRYKMDVKKEKKRERHWLDKPDIMEENLCETRVLTPEEIEELEQELMENND